MASFNKTVLLGNLVRDPEVKTFDSGQAVTKISVAVNENFKNKEGERQERTSFIDCEMWGKRGEILAQYTKKGDPILLEGRLRQDTWETEDGKRSKLFVSLDDFQFLTSGKVTNSGSAPEGSTNTEKSKPVPDGEDIPF